MTGAAGRFAPSPTGPLHAGSLLAATASFLDARAHGLEWRLRIDDIDLPRVVSGAERAILASLEAHGLVWDGEVIRQSQRLDRYEHALQQLHRQQLTFYCTCSRKQLAGHRRYPGTCRANRTPMTNAAVRLRVPDTPIHFRDLVSGPQADRLSGSCGDFVVRRRDGLIAYQLATAVDDGDPEIVRVVRGGDLLDNTPRQIYLMHCLGLSAPVYAHLPILVNASGQKLSKQSGAPALNQDQPTANLLAILPLLGLNPPPVAAGWSPDAVLHWASQRFDLRHIRPGSVPFT